MFLQCNKVGGRTGLRIRPTAGRKIARVSGVRRPPPPHTEEAPHHLPASACDTPHGTTKYGKLSLQCGLQRPLEGVSTGAVASSRVGETSPEDTLPPVKTPVVGTFAPLTSPLAGTFATLTSPLAGTLASLTHPAEPVAASVVAVGDTTPPLPCGRNDKVSIGEALLREEVMESVLRWNQMMVCTHATKEGRGPILSRMVLKARESYTILGAKPETFDPKFWARKFSTLARLVSKFCRECILHRVPFGR